MTASRREVARLTELKAQWLHILLSLADRDLHGLEIMTDVLKRTDGRIHLWPGALYGSLRSLEELGFVTETDPPDSPRHGGGKARYFRITPSGRTVLAEELGRLEEIVAVGRAKKVLSSE